MVTKPTKSDDAHRHHNVDEEVDDLSIDYPSSDGEPMAETDFQYIPLTETVAALRAWFHNRPDVYVAGDMLVYYRMNNPNVSVAPDIYAVFGAMGNHPRDNWLVWREGKAPDFVMEIASPRTWRRDETVKRDIYAGMGVSEYWRFDPTGRCFTPSLVGERLVNGEYQAITVSEDNAGILRGHSAILGLEICTPGGFELRVYDPVEGQWLPSRLLEEIDARRAVQATLRESEAENARLREELRRLQQQQ